MSLFESPQPGGNGHRRIGTMLHGRRSDGVWMHAASKPKAVAQRGVNATSEPCVGDACFSNGTTPSPGNALLGRRGFDPLPFRVHLATSYYWNGLYTVKQVVSGAIDAARYPKLRILTTRNWRHASWELGNLKTYSSSVAHTR